MSKEDPDSKNTGILSRRKIVKTTKLTLWRGKLNEIDQSIVDLLSKRLAVTKKIGQYKKRRQLPHFDLIREKEVIARLQTQTRNILLREKLPKLYHTIFSLVKEGYVLDNAPPIPFPKIGIIGLGLIGGSIVKTIKFQDPKILIYSLRRKNTSKNKLIKAELDKLEDLVKAVEIVILACPIDQVITYLRRIARISKNLKKKLILMDVASVKEEIVREMEKLTDANTQCLSTHPMAGSEKSGFINATTTLFTGKKWIICPHTNNDKTSLQKVKQLIASLGSQSLELEAQEHDKYLAYVSHLVFFLSTLLFSFVNDNQLEALQLAGPGFISATRLASGNPAMHTQISQKNSIQLAKLIPHFSTLLNSVDLNSPQLAVFFKNTKKKRDRFLQKLQTDL